MNAISVSAPPTRRPRLPTVRQVARKLGNLIAPRDHAGKGNWDNNADIPPLVAWPAGLGLAAFLLFGQQTLGWLLRLVA
ncbi:hypothetical protein [Achromobacter deleyi]|uniref:hypothetical protein n=1 Tax=Achromobacter deleyi TaxID=1353891 RepID=UPI0014909202|nr:hypothetical protein [Achromobacter deleyi]QVQ29319.1 hypothetical protein HLG70_13360 [Achromobacter deleyi]UIP19440.1 hypothetical protein LYZ39_20970 [Achromobacter deleyi]